MVVATIRTGLSSLFTALLDTIEAFTDYFILERQISLSEAGLLMFSALWAIWFLFFGVYVSEMVLSRAAWTTAFLMSTVLHIASFFIKDTIGRGIAVSLYAIIWCFLMVLSALTGSIAPAVPTLLYATVIAVSVAIRLFKERFKERQACVVNG